MSLASTPLRSVDPETLDSSDLFVLSELVGDARLVCLGESAHHISEFVQLHDRIGRYLVAEHGFTVLAFESGYPEGLMVDRWVRGSRGALNDVARRGMTWSFGRSVERHAQLRWMRAWNESRDRRIGFAGIDVPGGLTTPLPAISACLQRIPARSGDADLLAIADLDTGVDVPPVGGAAVRVPEELRSGVVDLIGRSRSAGDRIALQCALGARAVVEFLEHGLYPGPERNLRNEVMADNLRTLLDSGERVVVSAHNVHVQRAPSFDGTAPVGRILADELGSDLVVIGSTHAADTVPADPGADHRHSHDPARRFTATLPAPFPEGCLDAVLDELGALHAVDLVGSPLDATAGISTMRGQHLVVDVDPREAFDAVIHVRRTHPAIGADDD